MARSVPRSLVLVCMAALPPLGLGGWGHGASHGREHCPEPTHIQQLPFSGAPPPPPAAPATGDYRHQLKATAHGWPRRDHWCVWVEPTAADGTGARWELAWHSAVQAALASWGTLVPITTVEQRQRAHVLIERRRPPLRGGRASHGRAELALAVVHRGGPPQLEPLVTVQISPGQRPAAMEATALHELGHAFGLWGHSDQSNDAMAAVPGAMAVVDLSERDRATFRWLQQQPGLLHCVAGPCGP
jgi:hypothetical protein